MAGGTMRKNPSINNDDQPKILKPQQSSHFRAINSTLVLVSVLLVVVVILTSSVRYEGGGIYSFEVVNEFPHDPDAYTQGLLYVENDTLFESTGRIGHSSVREVDLLTGKIKALQNMDYSYFGEGLTLLGDRSVSDHPFCILNYVAIMLYQITYKGKTGFIYDRYNLSNFTSFTHDLKEGWGLATDGKVLIGTDGSSSLYHINPQTMKVVAEVVVKYKGLEVHQLNELEYINNELWANVSPSNCIARISPVDGTVIGWIVLPELREGLVAVGHKINVLNGIAWDDKRKRLFVTGKLWPKLYEIKLQPLRKPLQAPIEQLCLNAPFPVVT